jgi:1-phosphofructokinase family hexose kinase
MRVLTITCNPAIDTTYVIDQLALGQINRVDEVLPAPGGKGNNVARVLAALGHTPVATGFLGGSFGQFIAAGLESCGVEPSFIDVPGESRVCLTVVERGSGRTTEVREPGLTLAASDAQRLIDHVRDIAPTVGAAVISGSLPPGLEPSLYSRLIRLLTLSGAVVALDSSGAALREGLAGGPQLIKPNREELGDLVGETAVEAMIERSRRNLLGTRLPIDARILLSLGSDGAALIERERVWMADAPAVPVRNSVGSGDALLAGYLDAWSRGATPAEALAAAVAVGSAAAMQQAIGVVDTGDVAALRPVISVQERPLPPTDHTTGVRSADLPRSRCA